MCVQIEVFIEWCFYLDVNGILCVIYGKVDGYQFCDVVCYEFVIYLDGVMEKYVFGDYEFDVLQCLWKFY